jgi:oxalate decarboxylase
MRELHWHPDADEWQFYIAGEAWMTVFDATDKARTFIYRAGDVGFAPRITGHCIETIGTGPVQMLSVFTTSRFAEISLKRWRVLTPPALVQGHLGLDDSAMAALQTPAHPVTG